jgi:VCBS repeat-containing protein
MATFTLTPGTDNFTGIGTENNTFNAAAGTLQSTDVITGGSGSFIDVFALTSGGTVTTAQFSGVTGMEVLTLGATANVTLTNGLVGNSPGLFEVDGSSGSDTIDGSQITNGKGLLIFAGDGSDTLIGGNGDDTLVAHTVANIFSQEHDTLSGGAGNDTLYGEAADTLSGGAGFDVLHVINDYDMHLDLAAAGIEYVVSGFGNDVYTASAATVTIEVYGGGGNDQITGGSGDDNLWGGVGNDTLVGNDGNDLLVGDLGADSLSGGAGNDRLYIDSDDTFIDGGDGFDAAYIATGTGVTLNMATTHLEWVTDFAGGNDTIDASGVSVNVEIYGGAGTDNLTGGSGNDLIFAGSGDDTVVGGDGDDALVGEAGADSLSGGAGNDRLYVDSSDTLIDGGAGTDAVYIEGGAGLTINMATSNVEFIQDDVGGADIINGVGTAVRVFAGGGDDTIGITNGAFTTIAGGAGLDRIVLSPGQTFDLTANASKITGIEVISLDASSLTGSTLSLTNTDIPQINAVGNSLYVLGGADDTVNVGDTWIVVSTTHTNPAVSGDTFVHYHNTTTNSDLYIANDIVANINNPSNNPPAALLGGDPTDGDPGSAPDGIDYSTSYTTGNASGIAIGDTDATVDDPDTTDSVGVSSKITQLVATLTDPHSGALEFVTLTAAGQTTASNNGVTVSGLNSATLTLSGTANDTVYQSLLREVRYVNTDQSAALNTSDRHIAVTVSDGIDTSNVATATISITSGNGSPIASNFSINTQEDTNVGQFLNVLTASSASDPDADTLHISKINGSAANVGVQQSTAHGAVVVNSDGSAAFVLNNGSAAVQHLAAGEAVQDTFTFTVSDTLGHEVTRTVTIDVAGTNDAPVGGSAIGSQSATEDQAFSFAVPGSAFSDIDTTDTLTLSTVGTLPSWLTFNGTSFSGTPENADVGTYNITVKATDPSGTSAQQTFAITVANVNDNPVAASDITYTTPEDTQLVLAVLANDTDVDGPFPLAVARIDGGAVSVGQDVAVTGGSVHVNADGTLTFTPTANSTVDGSFTYTAKDGAGAESAAATVNIDVTPVNDAPFLSVPGPQGPTEDTQFTFNGGSTISVGDVDAGAATDFSVSLLVDHGSLQLVAQGGAVVSGTDTFAARTITGTVADVNATLATLKYTAVPNFFGVDTLVITANDNGNTGSGGALSTTSTVQLNVSATNDAPTANADTININEDQTPTINVLGNDFDPDGPFPLSIARINGASVSSGDDISITGGSLHVNADGSLKFTPTANLNNSNNSGPVTFTYTPKDGNGLEAAAPATVTLNITPVNDAPTATADKFTLNENGAASIGNVITGNNGNGIDSDVETPLANLTVTGIRFPGDASFTIVPNSGSATLTFTNGAQVTVDSAGNVTLAQNGAFESLGALQQDELSFQYRLADTGDPAGSGTGLGAPTTANANVRIVINGQNDAPVANADTYTTSEDTPAVLAVLGNDTDVDGPNPLAVARINGSTVSVGNDVSVTGGSVHVNADGTLTFTPTANSTADGTFTYNTKDGSGTESASAANVTVHVTAVNDAPVANADTTFTTPEDQGIILDILANDTDVEDGIPPEIATVNGTTLTVGQTIGVTGGTVTLNAAGAVFDPVTSTPVTYAHQTLTFTPNPNSDVDAAFVYTARDSQGVESAQASVAVDVTPVNDAPVAAPDSFTTLEDTPVTFDVRTNDTDVDNSTLVVTHINGTPFTGPGNTITLGDGATVHKNANGTLTYTPAHDVNGPPASPPSFTYTISDGLASSTSTVNITITPVNDAPVNTAPTAVTATEDTPFNFTGGNQLSVTDVDSNVTVTLSVDHGVLNVTGPGVTGSGTDTVIISSASVTSVNAALASLTYQGDSNFNGNDTLTMVTSDGSLSDTDTVAISVTAVADVSLYDSSNNLIATFDDLETAVLYAQDGQHIRMAAGNIALEGPGPHDGKVIVDKNITIEGAGKLATTLSASTSIANAQLSSAAAMIVVADGHTVDFSNFTVNGNDRGGGDVDVSTGILFDGGNGSATNMRFTNIGADVGDEPRGTGLVAWAGAQVSVTNSDFDQNERRGLAAFDPVTHVTISGSTFTAKTGQDEVGTFPGTVDYGVQASDGALVDISGSTFTNFSASENGFGSAGVLVAPVGGGTSTVNLNAGNTFTNNSVAVSVGFNATDTDIVHFNNPITVNSSVLDALGLQAFGDVVVTGVPANLSGGVVKVDWMGGPGANAIFGDDQNDTLQGNGGNDTILAGGGDDSVTYNVGDGSDTVDGGSNTATGDTVTINGTAGAETFDITGGSPTAPHIDVDINSSQALDITDVEEIVVNTNGGGDTVNISGSFAGTTLHTNSITVVGGAGNDTVNASGLTSTNSVHFTGDGGDDTFVSSNAGGNDTIDGGTNGANGDTVDYSAVTSAVTVDLSDTVGSNVSGTGAGADTLTNIENIVGGSVGDSITGSSANNVLSGSGGDDTMEGRGGDDTIYGGTSVGDSGHDTAVFTGNRADYTITRIGSGVYTVADSVGGRDATDTVHDVETLHFNGDASDVLLDAPIQVFDATDTVLLATFQANQLDQAVNYANTHAGANVIELQSSASPFLAGSWPVDITEAVTIKAVGGTATVNAGGNSAFTIESSAVLGASDSVRLEGLNITGNGIAGDTVGVLFNGAYEGPSDGAIQIVNTSASGFGSNGVAIIGGGSGLSVTMDGGTYTGSGYSSTSGGSGEIDFFEFTGAAAFKDLTVTGTTGTSTSSADNGIQIAGFDGTDHSVDHAIGTVSFDHVTVNGSYEKNLVYVQGYHNYNGLGFTNGLTLNGTTTWTALFIDGGSQGGAYINDGTSTLNLTGVTVAGGTYGTSSSFAALGGKPIVVNGVPTSDIITGTIAAEALIGSTGDDTINAGGGADLILYNVGDGHDTVDGQGGTDTLALVNLNAGVPSATPASFAVSESGGHLIVQTDGIGSPEVDAAGMESAQFVLGNGGDTVTLTGNIAGAGIATGAGGIIVTGGTGGDTLDASGFTSASAITFSNLGGGNDTFKAANVVANDTVDGAGGTGDSLDYSAASAAVSIDLTAGTASGTSVGSDTVANYENATGGAGGDTISGTSGANTLSGNGGDDTLTGRGGADTLVGGETGETHGDVAAYAQVITVGMIATNGSGGWTVTTAGAEGTDTLSEIEVVQGADPGPGTGKFLLVGNGGYATIAAAYAEAVDGDTIVLAPGTYADDFTVGKAISIVGANYNVDGDGTRAAESVLTGHWTVNAAGPVTIDGVEFLNNTPYTTGIDDTRLTIATDATVAHSLFYNTRPGGNKPISDIAVNVTAPTGTVSIIDNRFTGDFHGKYFNGNLTAGSADSASWGGGSNVGGDAGAIVWHGGSTLDIDGNTIEFARTALTLINGDDALLTINDNDFATNGTSITATGWQGPVTSVTNNAFTDVDNEFNLRSNATGIDINFGATGNTSDNWFSVLGTVGTDTITGTAGKDAILAEQGDDVVHTGQGNDAIFFNAGATAGSDTVDGGSESAGKDTLIVSNVTAVNNTLDPGDAGDPATSTSGSPSNTAVTFTMTDAPDTVTPTDGVNSTRDISVTASNGGSVTADEIEDVQFNLGNGGDTVNVSGDFTNTSLLPNTITVNGGNGADTVDARSLTSANNIVFNGNSGNDTFYESNTAANDTFNGGAGTNTVNFSAVTSSVSVNLSNTGAQNTGAGNDTFTNVQNVVGSATADNTFQGDGSNNAFTGGTGHDTATGYGAGYHIEIQSGHWVVTNGTDTDVLTDVERVDIAGTTYLLVDQFGDNVGGFQHVQDAVDFASGGETILIAPGTYSESGNPTSQPGNFGGLYIDTPNLTLQAVHADGSPITTAADAQSFGATIVAGHENNFGANHWVDVGGDNTVFNGLHFKAGAETGNKLLEIWSDNVTVENSFVDVYRFDGLSEVYTFAVAIYFNDNGSAATDEITKYTVDHNILNEGIIVANGVGDPTAGIGALQKITNNLFEGVFNYNTGLGRYDTVVLNGQVAGTPWLLESTQIPTISGNTFDNNTTPFLLRGSDNDPAKLPTAGQIATILASNGDNNLHYAYVLTAGGDLELADRNDGSGPYHSFAVTNTIDTLNLSLDSTADAVFGTTPRNYERAGDTVVIQSGDTGTVNSNIMVENLTVRATAHSADLNLTLATQYADNSAIPAGGVHNVNLADYAVGQGADVDVTGNALDNVIVGNSGNNSLNGGAGDDTLTGGKGNDVLTGGTNTAVGDTVDYSKETGGGGVTVDLGAGTATDTFGNTDTLSGIENAIGTSGADTFTAAATGVNTFTGGDGSDTYTVKAGDQVVELNGNAGGIDAVFTKDSFTLGANVENLSLLENSVSDTQTFETMALGPITDGENGWKVAGSHDQEIVDVSGNKMFRMSSDPSSGDFGGPYSPALSAAAGEPDTGAAYSGQSIKFDFKAVHAVPDGSRLEVDFGNAAGTDRNNFLVIESSATTGIRIAVSEPTSPALALPDGSPFSGDNNSPAPNDWRELVTGVDPAASHTLEMRLAYVDGQNNDVISVYLDGQYIGQTTTFENYHDSLGGTHIANATANLTDRVFFRGGANGSPQDGPGGTADAGFYFDNVTTSVYNNTSGTGNDLANVITGNSGDNTLTGLGANDTLNGGLGTDTAVYQDARSNYAITATTDSHGLVTGFSQVQETGAPGLVAEGTDTLTSIERLSFSDVTLNVAQRVQLFDGSNHLIGTFDTIQAAINAGADGDIIRLAAGTYDENVNVSKNIEIDGANSGTAGAGLRVAESVIRGQMTVTAAHSASNLVTINGVEVYNTSDNTQPFVGIQVNSAADVTITNSMFFSPVPNGSSSFLDRAILLPTSASGTIHVDNNLFTGASHSAFSTASWTTAIWSDGHEAAGSSIDHNTFEFVRTGINADDFNNGLTIASNTFQNSGSGVSIGGVGAVVSNMTSIHDNTFTNVDTDFNLQNVTTPIGFDLTATNNHTSGTSSGTVLGGSDGDTIKGSSDNDILVGNNGADTLTGGAGNDTLQGNGGTDTADYSHDGGSNPVTVNLTTGLATDTFGNTDTLSGIENAIGTSGADTFTAAATGVNTFTGGDGSDTYTVKAGDQVVELNGNAGGIDAVFTKDSFTLGANVENLSLLENSVSDTQTFETMALGPITDGENGWKVAGSHDQEIVDVSGNKMFRMSSDPSSGDFGGPYSPALSAAAGEPDTGAAYSGQSIKFDFKAVHAVPDGSRLEVDFGNAAGTDRNNFLVIESSATTGIRIAVSEPTSPALALPDGSPFSGDNNSPAPNDWRELVTGVDPAASHTLEMRLAYVDGQNNDVISVYLDGQYIGQTTTFENYHDSLGGTHIANATANLTDRVFFRGGANGSPQDGPGGTADAGFYFDNVTTSVYNNTSGTGNDLANVITGNSGDNTLTGLGANDTLNGGLGTDTAVYQDARSNYAITATTDSHGLVTGFSQVQETGAPGLVAEGTDTLTSIERLSFSDVTLNVAQRVQLFDGSNHLIGTFDTIQAAINAGADGDIIRLAAGTYDENVAVDKALTILGANHGVAGDASRGPESIIDGGFRLTASDVTIDGLNIINGRDDFGQQRAAVFIDGARANITVENSILDETTTSHPELTQAAILSTYNADTPNLQLLHNVIENWDEGMYLNPGVHDSTFDGNVFVDNGNHIISDGIDDFTITNNDFGASDGSKIFVNVYANPTDLEAELGLAGNTFAPDHARLSVAPYGPSGQVVLGTSGNDNLRGDYGITVGVSFDGRAGNDLLVGTGGNDTLTGGTGDDTIVGGAGSDTAQYSGTIAATDIAVTAADTDPTLAGTQPGWSVNGGAEGTDTLTGVEIVDGANAGRVLLVGNGGYATIGAALAAAVSGDTLLIAPGTYNENVVVNTANLTIKGAAAGVVIHGSFKSDNGIADGGVATFLKSGAGYTQTAGSGIAINADNVSISNVQIDGFTYGVNLGDGVDFASVSNVSFTDNLVGIKKGTTADITNFSLTQSSITDGLMGIDFDKDVTDATPAHKGNGLADVVTINGVSFSDLVYKGAYFEALSNAHLTNITMTDVAQFGAPSTSGTAGSGGNGIDLNLKNGDYSNVEIDNFTLTNVGASDREGADAVGHQNGGAIVLESRDQGSYLPVPATFTGAINVHDGTISGHTSTGIQVGEPNQNNADPDVTVTNVSITGEQHTPLPNGHGDLAIVTQSTLTVNMLNGGDSLVASPTTTGTMVVNGGTGADTITTGGGADTIDAGAGSDTVNAGGGSDHLIGNIDGVTDTYDGGTGGDTVNALAGTGGDTIDYSATTNGISVTLSGGGATVTDDEAGTDTLAGIENVTGGSGIDTLTGDNNANILIGNAGADSLTGSGGNDRLVGGSGADSLSGGTGADVFVYEHRADAGTAAGGEDLISGYSVTDADAFAFKADFFDGIALPGNFNDGAGHVNSSYFLVTNVGDDVGHTYGGAAGQPIFVLDDVTAGFAGTLWFDAEGDGQLNGANDAKIADLSNASVLTGFSHNDLLLI